MLRCWRSGDDLVLRYGAEYTLSKQHERTYEGATGEHAPPTAARLTASQFSFTPVTARMGDMQMEYWRPNAAKPSVVSYAALGRSR